MKHHFATIVSLGKSQISDVCRQHKDGSISTVDSNDAKLAESYSFLRERMQQSKASLA